MKRTLEQRVKELAGLIVDADLPKRLQAERDVLVAALRMCRQAMNDYLTMAEDEATCRRQFLRCREAVNTALPESNSLHG